MKRSPLARSNLRFATRRCPGRWAVLTGSAAVAAALACSNAAAQLEQSVRQNLPGFTQPQGPKPSLVAPPAGAQIASSATSPAPLDFRWSLAPGAPAPQRFVICVAEAGATCNRAGPQAMLVDVAAASTQHRTWIAPALHEKPLEWTVGACGPGYGGGTAVTQGTINADCTWADRRGLSAGYVPPLINLGSPGDGVTAAAPAQRFTWQQPRGVAIDGYRFCLADTVAVCEQSQGGQAASGGQMPPGQAVIVPVGAELAAADVDTQPLRRDFQRTMVWTVLSCRAGTCRLAAGQPARRFILPGRLSTGASVPLTSIGSSGGINLPSHVHVTFEEFRVGGTCDNVSPGDWMLRFVASERRRGALVQRQVVNVPGSGSRNVRSGERVLVDQTVTVPNVAADSDLVLAVSAVDCDSDAVWRAAATTLLGVPGVAELFRDWSPSCSGEEVFEASFGNDFVGTASVQIEPRQWLAATQAPIGVSAESVGTVGQEVCTAEPFTVQFEVRRTPLAP